MKNIRIQRHKGFRRPTSKDTARVDAALAEWTAEQRELAAFDGRNLTDADTTPRRYKSALLVNDGWTEVLVRTSDDMVVFFHLDHELAPAQIYGLGK